MAYELLEARWDDHHRCTASSQLFGPALRRDSTLLQPSSSRRAADEPSDSDPESPHQIATYAPGGQSTRADTQGRYEWFGQTYQGYTAQEYMGDYATSSSFQQPYAAGVDPSSDWLSSILGQQSELPTEMYPPPPPTQSSHYDLRDAPRSPSRFTFSEDQIRRPRRRRRDDK